MPRIKPHASRTPKNAFQPYPKSKPPKYELGQHGAKTREQQRLSAGHKTQVNGKTHESEHTVGFEPLNRTSGKSRKQNAALEKQAPAYQEVKEAHRKHVGTGNKGRDESGFDSSSYRDAQRKLITQGDVSSAVQLNQLGYAFDSKVKKQPLTPKGRAADDSYDKMVQNMKTLPHAQGNKTVQVPVDARQQAEMHLARRATQTGKFPTVAEENAARTTFGLPLIKG
jgi:Agrobacterium VirD5 protein